MWQGDRKMESKTCVTWTWLHTYHLLHTCWCFPLKSQHANCCQDCQQHTRKKGWRHYILCCLGLLWAVPLILPLGTSRCPASVSKILQAPWTLFGIVPLGYWKSSSASRHHSLLLSLQLVSGPSHYILLCYITSFLTAFNSCWGSLCALHIAVSSLSLTPSHHILKQLRQYRAHNDRPISFESSNLPTAVLLQNYIIKPIWLK